MKIISMIPARYAASRFPGKLMQDLGGKSVILRTYEATVATQLFDDVIVVTDSPIIYDEIINNGGKAMMSKKEHDCGSDRIAEAVEFLDIDIVINVQGDEPFTEKESLKKLIEVFKDDHNKSIDLASLMVHITDIEEINNPNTVKVIVDRTNFALYFSRSPIPYPRDEDSGVKYYKHKGIYAFRKEAILDFYNLPMLPLEASEKIECIRYLEYGKRIKMVETDVQGVEIDTPEDLERAKKNMEIEYKNIKVIGFDADDTLWVNETYFREAEVAFGKLLSDYETINKIDQELFKKEIDNLPLYGYGVKAFVLSMVESSLEISNYQVTSKTIDAILQIGKDMLEKPVELLEDVEEVLKELSKKYKLILATKGDLLDQERKLEKSGLTNYFHHIEVLSDKQEGNYSKLLNHLDIKPSEFLMIGNSLKSDVLPLVNIKAHAVHIPFHTTWAHEQVTEKETNGKAYKTIGRLREVLNLLD